MTYETMRLDVRDGVAHLTLNRPDDANGINLALAQRPARTPRSRSSATRRRGWSCSPAPARGSAAAAT